MRTDAQSIARIEQVIMSVWGEIRTLDTVVDVSSDKLIAFRSEMAIPLLNMVLAAHLDDELDTAKRTIAEFISYNRPWTWWVLPSYESPRLTDLLRSHGLTPQPIHGVERLVTAEGVVGAARDQPRLEEVPAGDPMFVSTLGRAYGLPEEVRPLLGDVQRAVHRGSSVYVVAFDADRPVGTGTGFVVEDVIEIHNVSSTEGDEVGIAIIAYLVAEGRRRGCRYATGVVDPDGVPLYEAAGFSTVCETTQWVWHSG